MAKIQILTDSTSAIPIKLLKKFKIETVPVNIFWDGQTFADGIDLKREVFFKRMRTSYETPLTAAPTPGAFNKAFEKLGKKEGPILAILMGNEFSSTLQTAKLAAELHADKEIVIWDSHSMAMGMGFQVLAAVRAVSAGKNLRDILEILKKLKNRSGVLLSVDDLKALRSGGRLSVAQYLIANAMRIKPLLEVRAGPVVAVDQIRRGRDMDTRMLNLLRERVGKERPLRVAVGYSDNKDKAEILVKMLKADFDLEELMLVPISQANCVHVGIGALGISYSYGI